MSKLPPVLDVCCGPKGFWFDKNNGKVLFMDKRRDSFYTEYPSGNYTDIIDPDLTLDFSNMPFKDNTFYLIVFDPPHIPQEKPTGRIIKRYGHLSGGWKEMLRNGFSECFRVLKPKGTLIFKWNECRVPVKDILALTNEPPLFGHQSGKRMGTHWIVFIKA